MTEEETDTFYRAHLAYITQLIEKVRKGDGEAAQRLSDITKHSPTLQALIALEIILPSSKVK